MATGGDTGAAAQAAVDARRGDRKPGAGDKTKPSPGQSDLAKTGSSLAGGDKGGAGAAGGDKGRSGPAGPTDKGQAGSADKGYAGSTGSTDKGQAGGTSPTDKAAATKASKPEVPSLKAEGSTAAKGASKTETPSLRVDQGAASGEKLVLWGVGTPEQVKERVAQDLKDKGIVMEPGAPDARTDAQKAAGKLEEAAKEKGVTIPGLDTGEKRKAPEPTDQRSKPSERPVGPVEEKPPTHDEVMNLWRTIEPDVVRRDDYPGQFEKEHGGITRDQVKAAFAPVLKGDARRRAEMAKSPTIDVDTQAQREVLWEAFDIAVKGGFLSSAVGASRLGSGEDPRETRRAVQDMANTARLLDGFAAPTTSSKRGPSDGRPLRRSDPQGQRPPNRAPSASPGGPARDKPGPKPAYDPLTGVPSDATAPGKAGAPQGPVLDQGGPSVRATPRTPEQAAREYVARHDGRVVDRDGALTNIFRLTRDAGDPSKGRAPQEAHVNRTAASRELADIEHLLRHPDVDRVEVVPSRAGQRTNDLDVYWKDGSRTRWEVTTVTSAPRGRMSTDHAPGRTNPLVAARNERIPTSSMERQASLRGAIDAKQKGAGTTRPQQTAFPRSDGMPPGGTLSVHAPYANSTRADCTQAVNDMASKLTSFEREVVVWRFDRNPSTGALQSYGERYARQADGTYKHNGTLTR
jgi:hypothetical protein